jgi:hypothetical protein
MLAETKKDASFLAFDFKHSLFSSKTLDAKSGPASPVRNGALDGVPKQHTPSKSPLINKPNAYVIDGHLLA